MYSLEAIVTVLSQVGKPLHYKEITRRILEQDLWSTKGKTPEATISANLSIDINENGVNSRFQRTGRGTFGLREWKLPEYPNRHKNDVIPTDQARQITPDQLQTYLWESANILRGEMGPGDYANYILGLFFLKRLSDVYEDEFQKLKEEAVEAGHTESEAEIIASDPDEHQFVIPRIAQWSYIRTLTTNIGDHLNKACKTLEDSNLVLGGIFSSIDFDSIRLSDRTLQSLVHHFDQITLGEKLVSKTEQISEIYRSLLNRFTEAADKRGGEFYIPNNLVELMVQLSKLSGGMRVYDPSAGTGGMLLEAARQVEKQGGNLLNLSLFGEENNSKAWALGKINMLLSGLPDTRIALSNALYEPHFTEDGKLMQFNRVISFPPFALRSSKLGKLEEDTYGRFPYGLSRNADFAYIQHIIASLKPDGRAVVMIALGILFRDGREGEIRKKIVEADLVEAVISLPANLLSGMGVQVALLILNKAKSAVHKGKILFVYADEMYEQGERQRVITSDEHQQAILEAVIQPTTRDKFTALVPITEVAFKDYRLLPVYFVDLIDKNNFLGGTAQWVSFSDIAEVYQGVTRFKEGGKKKTPIIRSRDLTIVGLSVNDLEQSEMPGENERAVFSKIGDILIQSLAQSPKALLIEASSGLDEVVISDTVIVLRLGEEHKYLARYLVEFLNSDRGQALFHYQGMIGVAIQRITATTVRRMQIPIPSPQVIALINELHEIENTFLKKVNRARHLRQQIFGIEDPELVTTTLSTLNIDAQVLRESIVQIEDLSFQIRNFYPSALAYAYRTLDSDQSKAALYKQQLRVAENVLALLGSIGLALVGRKEDIDTTAFKLTNEMLREYWRGGISPGDWLDIGNRTAKIIRGDSHAAVDSFANIWFKKRNSYTPSSFADLLKKLVQLKNEFKHDRGPQDDQGFAAAVPGMQEHLRDCFRQIAFLMQYPVRFIHSISIEWQSNRVRMDTLLCRGDHPVLRQEQIILDKPLADGKLFMELASDTWVSLYPLLSVQYNPQSKTRETYMIDAWNGPGDKIRLKSFERGHVLDDTSEAKQVGYDLDVWLNNLFSRMG